MLNHQSPIIASSVKSQNTMSLRDLAFCCFRLNTPFGVPSLCTSTYRCFSRFSRFWRCYLHRSENTKHDVAARHRIFCFSSKSPIWGDTSPSCGYRCFRLLVVLECAQHCIRVKTQNTMSLRDLAFCDFRAHPDFGFLRLWTTMHSRCYLVPDSPWY